LRLMSFMFAPIACIKSSVAFPYDRNSAANSSTSMKYSEV
jgi:hypothetical protein